MFVGEERTDVFRPDCVKSIRDESDHSESDRNKSHRDGTDCVNVNSNPVDCCSN
jgi:hypothetical protein